jgi:hypothetical protein
MINKNVVSAINNNVLAVAEVLPYPPSYSNDAKILLPLLKTLSYYIYYPFISTGLFWSVIKFYEFKSFQTLFKILNE